MDNMLSYYEEVSLISSKDDEIFSKVYLVKDKRYGNFCIKKYITIEEAILKEIIRIQTEQTISLPYGIPKIYGYAPYEEDETSLQKKGQENDTFVVIEEYINAPTFTKVLENEQVTPRECAGILALVCKILESFHNAIQPIIHRDMKPDNILVDINRFRETNGMAGVFVIDFNAAKIMREEKERDTHLMGTTGYAAPEQFGYSQSDARTDIFGIGATLRACREYVLFSPKQKGEKEAFNNIIETATKQAQNERYQSVTQFEKVLSYFYTYGKLYDVKQDKKVKGHTFRTKDLIPPGFRTRSIWKMLLSIFIYYECFYIAGFIEMPEAAYVVNMFAKFCGGMILVSYFWLASNYMDMWKRLILLKDSRLLVKILGVIVYVVVVFLFWVLVTTAFDFIYVGITG